MPRRGLGSPGTSLAALYLVAIVGVEVLRRTTGRPRADDLASTPAGVAAGHVWPLLTSGFVVAGDPLVQLPALALTALAVVRVLGASVFWLAVATAHVGSAIVAYVGVGALTLVPRVDVDAVVEAPDYGISCVWAGAVGALVAAGLATRRRRERLLSAGALAGFLAVSGSSGLATVEHVLSLGLGALVVTVLGTRVNGSAAQGPRPVPVS